MEVVASRGKPDLAQIHVAHMRNDPDYLVEFVDACDPAMGDRRRKWVIVISTQFGCPIRCLMCDAGGEYRGNLNLEELRFQIDTVVSAHEKIDPQQCGKFKIQFARMGEPALNDAVLDALGWLRERHPNAIPCIATTVPAGRGSWFANLLEVREQFHDFQLQLSINSTDESCRDRLMPYPKMPWQWLAQYGKEFFRPGQRKVCLNFALCPEVPVDAKATRELFDPDYFIIKLTPLNPTVIGRINQMTTTDDRPAVERMLARKSEEFQDQGFSVIQSIGNLEENLIGSNCGQMALKLRPLSGTLALAR